MRIEFCCSDLIDYFLEYWFTVDAVRKQLWVYMPADKAEEVGISHDFSFKFCPFCGSEISVKVKGEG
jgi:hypothetical protein